MTDEERANRNPKPEAEQVNLDDYPEVFIKDLEMARVYILKGERIAATFNYVGEFTVFGQKAYRFYAPRIEQEVRLRARPDGSGALEDGRGVKVTIRKYSGPDA